MQIDSFVICSFAHFAHYCQLILNLIPNPIPPLKSLQLLQLLLLSVRRDQQVQRLFVRRQLFLHFRSPSLGGSKSFCFKTFKKKITLPPSLRVSSVQHLQGEQRHLLGAATGQGLQHLHLPERHGGQSSPDSLFISSLCCCSCTAEQQ